MGQNQQVADGFVQFRSPGEGQDRLQSPRTPSAGPGFFGEVLSLGGPSLTSLLPSFLLAHPPAHSPVNSSHVLSTLSVAVTITRHCHCVATWEEPLAVSGPPLPFIEEERAPGSASVSQAPHLCTVRACSLA